MNIITGINQQPNIRLNANLNINHNQNRYNRYGHSNITFGSQRSERVIGLLDDQIKELVNSGELDIAAKIKFKKILKEALPDIMTQSNFINKGRSSKVYRINDNYVAKVKRGHYEDDAVKSYNLVSLPSQKFKELDFYYGEPVIRTGNVEILKNATPTKNNTYCGVKYNDNHSVSKEEIRRYKEEYLPLCASLPQESFDNLAQNLKKLNDIHSFSLHGFEYYTPDIINPNNLIIADGKFKLVDELDTVHCKKPNSLYTMLEPLIIRMTPEHYAEFDKDLVQDRRTILTKCMTAAQNVKLPASSPLKYRYSDFTLQKILTT